MKFFEFIVLLMICINGYSEGCSILCPECTQLCIDKDTGLGADCSGAVGCWMECPTGTYGTKYIRPNSSSYQLFCYISSLLNFSTL